MMMFQIFHKYLNRYFVETGTLHGAGVMKALEAGFKNIISIELDEKLAQTAKCLFGNEKKVTIVQGDAVKVLGETIRTINEPITFWLDGHYSGGPTACGEIPDPIIQELLIIEQHPIKNHAIIIDDIRFYGEDQPIKLSEIKTILRRINPDYRFVLEDGFVPNDILVAF